MRGLRDITDESFTVLFDNVPVPVDRLVGGDGSRLRVAFDGTIPARHHRINLQRHRPIRIDEAQAYARERHV